MNRIKCLRLSRRMSQIDFARLFHVDQTAVSNWEKEKNGIDPIIAVKIAEYFNVPLEFVYGKPFFVKRPFINWNSDELEDYDHASPEAKPLLEFKFGKGFFHASEDEEKPADNGELLENTIIYHRDGKTERKQLTKEQMDMIAAMLATLPDTPKDI